MAPQQVRAARGRARRGREDVGILSPWVEATRLIGSDELTWVMENALAEAE